MIKRKAKKSVRVKARRAAGKTAKVAPRQKRDYNMHASKPTGREVLTGCRH